MKAPVPSRRAVTVLAWFTGLVVLLLIVWLVAKVTTFGEENRALQEQDRQSQADRAQLFKEVAGDKRDILALREQLRQLGEQPVVQPEDVPEDLGIAVIPGPRGLSCIEEIGYPRCRGTQGQNSTVPGPKGDDSTVPGPRGPGCVEEVGLDSCRGPSGKDGAAGTNGKDGVDGKDGRDGTAKPGTYTCADGEVQRGFTVAEDGSVSLICVPLNPGNPGGNP